MYVLNWNTDPLTFSIWIQEICELSAIVRGEIATFLKIIIYCYCKSHPSSKFTKNSNEFTDHSKTRNISTLRTPTKETNANAIVKSRCGACDKADNEEMVQYDKCDDITIFPASE